MVSVAIVGAAGYAGAELTRLVLGHPLMELAMVTSSADAGRRVSQLYPALAGCDLVYVPHDAARVSQVAQVAFLAVPHTAAMAIAPGLLEAGLTVIDASADFRLRDPGVFSAWYGTEHACPDLLCDAVYGLPELWRDAIPKARLVACPGCYPTATLLAAAPAIEAGIVTSGHVIVDAKSGVSGAGRTPTSGTHFVAAAESVTAYKVGAHRHTPEIAQGLEDLGLTDVRVTFSPHLVPMSRGLLSTVYLDIVAGMPVEDAHAVYAEYYADELFVTVHPPGVMPSTSEVRGSNRAHIGVTVDGAGTLVVSAAIDNLVKGTAGQAIQCANLALGYEETTGLDRPAPVF
ncbi:MAG: N-acetyl-gamma-glutamyl-phosphate reductase [Coriobacteriia bacterium]|nr:N-acetyl-gamma-glutamyl-phosphate reductase [Coriobacteriia bacterium]MBN2822057.1 N-acetyl-gamma-glutamyl-phosphate reductase [Coriobacteriia bacterium]